MSVTAPHRIKRLVFELAFADSDRAFQTRHRLAQRFQEEIVPVLEEAFDRYASDGRLHRIDRLDVELGSWNPAAPWESLQERVASSLIASLQGLPPSRSEQLSPAASLAEALREFLRRGFWSWRVPYRNLRQIEQTILNLTPDEALRLVNGLRLVLQEPQPALRLASQFSPEFAHWVLTRLHPEAPRRLELLRSSAAPGGLHEPVALLIRAAAVAAADSSSVTLDREIGKLSGLPPTAPTLTETADPELPAAAGKPPASPAKEAPAELSVDEEIFVPNAGIVLLHPFLPRLFQVLGLVDQSDRFISTEAPLLALKLLDFLVSGGQDSEEIQAPLYKILCGLPLAAPLPPTRRLKEREKEEGRQLLKSAIRHWKKLGRASIDGLRQGFLQREGRLSRQQPGWKLVVETRGVDVLLGSLPWSLSIVRLGWMDAPLAVDWV